MALSGSITTNKYSTSSHGNIGLQLSWTATQSISDNSSTISWTLKSVGTMSSGYSVQAGPVTVKIAGKTVLNTTSRFSMYGGGSYRKTGTLTVEHNEDGSKSVSMSVKAAIYSASVNCTASKTFDLNKINRYAIINSVTMFDDEGNPVITYSNPAGTDLVTNLKVRLKWDDTSSVEQTTAWVSLADDGSDSPYTFNISNEDRARLRAACPDDNELKLYVDLQSEMDSTEYHDTKRTNMKIVNAEPIFTVAAHYEDANSNVVSITGSNQIIIQKQSKLRIYCGTAQAQKGATSIVKYILSFNGLSYDFEGNYVEIDKPDLSGVYLASIRAIDTRRNTGISNVSIDITGWAVPSADCTLERYNGFETRTVLTVNATITAITGSSLAIYERHREKGGSWSVLAAVSNNTPTDLTLLNTKEWDVEVQVSDSFTTSTPTSYILSVGKGIPTIFIDPEKGSVAIHGFPDDDEQLFVGGTLKLKPHETDSGVILPHVYSDTEQIVGYWIDGSPIYERTLSLQADVTVNANAWAYNAVTVNENIIVIDGLAMYYNTQYDIYSIWNFMSLQTNTSDKKKIDLYNSRDASCLVNVLIIKYIKVPQS